MEFVGTFACPSANHGGMAMSYEREAEVLEMPTQSDTTVAQARRVAQGRAAIERYVERLENATNRLKTGPEAAELFCALAELREGLIENDPVQVETLYRKALESFSLSHIANLGLRRLSRFKGDFEATIASIEREVETLPEEKRRDLQLELARTWLYCARDAEKAIAILESMEANESTDSMDSTLVPEIAEPFDAEMFLLWEDALLASGAYDRYEGKLRQALHRMRVSGALTQHVQERLWMLYRYIMPDEEQAQLLCNSLLRSQPIDDELVEDVLLRAQRSGNHDAVVSILKKALERLEGSPRERYYRALLADEAQFAFEDREHAMDVLRHSRSGSDLVLLQQQIELLEDYGQTDELLDALAKTLELMHTPQLKAEQLYVIACILRDEMDQPDAALEVFEEANEIYPAHEATIDALAEVYTERGNWEKLSQLYEYELVYAQEHELPEYTPDVYVARHARLAYLYEYKFPFALKAFNHYQAMLKYRADDIAALKGASRMAQSIGNWTEMLQLYAAAEGCTQDTREHVYLLERIAQIADVYMNDADTACTALEALRAIDSPKDGTTAALARLYIKLKKWEELIALTDEEIETVTNPEYKASLLCRNAEVSEYQLSNIPQAILYYEKARGVVPGCRQAVFALERIYEHQHAWEKLVELLKAQVALTADTRLKCAYLRKIAETLDIELDREEEAVAVYENALRINPKDEVSRHYLLAFYRAEDRWEEVLRILNVEIEAGGTLGAPWLTHFWKGRIELYHLNNEMRALESFAQAFLLNPNDHAVMRMWLSLSLRSVPDEETLENLKKALDIVSDEAIHDEIELAIADLTLRATHDPKSIESMVASYESSVKFKGRGARFLTTTVIANDSANGRWTSRISLAMQPRMPVELQKHGLQAAVVLNMPEDIVKRAQEVLCHLNDADLARQLWWSTSPAKRPSYRHLSADILSQASREAQDLRRWQVICRLLAGDIAEPTDHLLPDNRDDNLSYRPDLELLAAYFERFEKWSKLLEVLNVQEENTLNEAESIQIALQRAWVLVKIGRHEDALESVRKACDRCSFDNHMRLSLYDYLSHEKDWDFLAEQIRQHLMNTDDNVEKSNLWIRLAEIHRGGMNNLQEAVRCLNQAYQEDSSRGDILCDIAMTAQQINDIDIARRALDDYIQYHHPSLEEQLELEEQLLDLHFNYPGGDTDRMIEYFDMLVKKTARSTECLIILAHAHAIAGDPQIATEIILHIVAYPFEEKDLDLWLVLVDLYLDRLGEQKKGEELLWELFKTWPHIEYVFERLQKLYVDTAERRIMVANIQRCVSQSEAIRKEPALVRRYLGFAADVLSELGAWKEAQDLYSAAIDACPEPDSALIRSRAHARCRIPGEARSAYIEFCDLLVQDPFQTDIYSAALEICRRNKASDRERIFRQMASIFVPESGLGSDGSDLRPKMMDSRPLSDDVLKRHMTHPDLRPVLDLLHEAMPILNNTLRDMVPKRTNLGGEKIKNQAITNIFNMCAAAFGIKDVKGLYGHDLSPMPIVLDDPEAYWIPLEIWETMRPELQRHWAGYASGLLWTGISRMTFFEPNEVWHLLDGIYYLVTNRGITARDAYTIEASERVNSAFQRGTRRDVAKIIDEIGPETLPKVNAAKWQHGLLATADRAGLLFSGSLTASIPAILEAEGWNPDKTGAEYLAARVRHSRRISELIAFALSDDYLQLRFHAGLAMQPSKIM
ncbi:MAG: tetratricopeptide repeat protein [Proteobacteria bacterium]|nr:tetratricopeptide repeat protein [Pseudomonadota bacterium]